MVDENYHAKNGIIFNESTDSSITKGSHLNENEKLFEFDSYDPRKMVM